MVWGSALKEEFFGEMWLRAGPKESVKQEGLPCLPERDIIWGIG